MNMVHGVTLSQEQQDEITELMSTPDEELLRQAEKSGMNVAEVVATNKAIIQATLDQLAGRPVPPMAQAHSRPASEWQALPAISAVAGDAGLQVQAKC